MQAQEMTGWDRQPLLEWNCHHYESRIVSEFRKRMREDLEKSRLGLAMGLRREDWIERLWSMGIREENHTALHLLPLVMVGWADGVMERGEAEKAREGVLSLNPPLSSEALELFQRWLKQKPDPWLWKVWETLTLGRSSEVAGMAEAPPLQWAAEWSERVAEASGGLLGIGKVCGAEQAILDRIGRHLSEN